MQIEEDVIQQGLDSLQDLSITYIAYMKAKFSNNLLLFIQNISKFSKFLTTLHPSCRLSSKQLPDSQHRINIICGKKCTPHKVDDILHHVSSNMFCVVFYFFYSVLVENLAVLSLDSSEPFFTPCIKQYFLWSLLFLLLSFSKKFGCFVFG